MRGHFLARSHSALSMRRRPKPTLQLRNIGCVLNPRRPPHSWCNSQTPPIGVSRNPDARSAGVTPAVSALGEQSNILQRRRTLERRKDCAFGAGVSTRRIPSTSSASLSGHDKSPSNPALYLVSFLHAFPPGVSCKWRGDILPPACARPGFASRRAGRNPDDPVSVPMRLRPSSGNFNPIRRRHRSCCSGLRPGGRHHRGYSRFNSR